MTFKVSAATKAVWAVARLP